MLIYIAENDPQLVSQLQQFLPVGCQTVVFRNGLEAYACILEAPPDLLVADAWLPQLGGVALTRLLKQHETYQSTPVIVVGGSTGTEALALSVGADAYLAKPLDERQCSRLLEGLSA